MISLWEDLRYGFRALRSTLGFTAVAVLTLGIGIAANTTVFSWIDAVLMHPLPGAGDANAIYTLETVTSTGSVLGNVSFVDYRDYRDHVRAFEELAVARITNLTYGVSGKTEKIWGELVSPNYFQLLRVKPILGSVFDPSRVSEAPNAAPYAVIGYHFWQNRLQGDSAVVGKTIKVNLRDLTVLGVVGAEFGGATPGLAFDIWIPLSMAPGMGTGGGTLEYRGTRDLTTTLARLKPGFSLADAAGEAKALAARMAVEHAATNKGISVRLLPVSESARGAQMLLRGPLGILMAVCVLLFLIVCANVANLLLVRFTARQKELGIRLSMGAPWQRLLRQLLVETFLLAVAGGGLGVLLSQWMSPLLAFLLPPNDFPVRFGSPLGGMPLTFTLLLSVAATLLCGAIPAVASLRQNLHGTLKAAGRSETSNLHTGLLRRAIVVTEVTLATVALIGTGLFMASFRNVVAVDPGFRLRELHTGQFYLSPLGYNGKTQRAICVRLQEQLARQSGIAGSTYTDTIPLQLGLSPWHQIGVEGYTPAPGENLHVHRSMVAPGYFAFLEIPVLEGREFDSRDIAGAPNVVIVNQTFARKYFAGANPVGRRIDVDGRWATVVGMVKDTKYHSLAEGPMPYFYRAFLQNFAPGLNFSFIVRSTGDPATAYRQLRQEALRTDPNAQVYHTMSLADAIGSATYSHKVAAYLLSGLGLTSVLLASLGIFGVVSFAVARRTREVAIRVALGATSRQVLRAILPEGVAMVLLGLLCGVPIAAFAGGRFQDMLVGVRPWDPVTLSVSAGLLLAVGVLAALIPAVWATRIEPAKALRGDS